MAKVSQPPVNDVVDADETYDPFCTHKTDNGRQKPPPPSPVKLPKIVY